MVVLVKKSVVMIMVATMTMHTKTTEPFRIISTRSRYSAVPYWLEPKNADTDDDEDDDDEDDYDSDVQ